MNQSKHIWRWSPQTYHFKLKKVPKGFSRVLILIWSYIVKSLLSKKIVKFYFKSKKILTLWKHHNKDMHLLPFIKEKNQPSWLLSNHLGLTKKNPGWLYHRGRLNDQNLFRLADKACLLDNLLCHKVDHRSSFKKR